MLTPGGVFAARDRDLDGDLAGGPDLDRYWAWWSLFAEVMKGRFNLRLGKHLRGMLVESGFEDVRASLSHEVWGTPDRVAAWLEVWMLGWRESGWAYEAALKSGLTDEAVIQRHRDDWERWAANPGAWYALCRAEVVGWKPQTS